MKIGGFAENYVKEYFKTKKEIELIKAPKGELGYDFRDSNSKLFIEVKGTTAKKITDVLFRYFTNTEYEKARLCRKNKQKYEIHLITGIGSSSVEHYVIPGEILLEKAKPEIVWSLPIRKEDNQYNVKHKKTANHSIQRTFPAAK